MFFSYIFLYKSEVPGGGSVSACLIRSLQLVCRPYPPQPYAPSPRLDVPRRPPSVSMLHICPRACPRVLRFGDPFPPTVPECLSAPFWCHDLQSAQSYTHPSIVQMNPRLFSRRSVLVLSKYAAPSLAALSTITLAGTVEAGCRVDVVLVRDHTPYTMPTGDTTATCHFPVCAYTGRCYRSSRMAWIRHQRIVLYTLSNKPQCTTQVIRSARTRCALVALRVMVYLWCVSRTNAEHCPGGVWTQDDCAVRLVL